MKPFVYALLACALLNACATAYVGPKPDFSKSGVEAEAEYKKFKLGTSYGELNVRTADMGRKLYYLETVEPIISEVSPTFPAKLKTLKTWQYVSWGVIGVMLAAAFQPRNSWAFNTGYWIGFGAFIGTSVYTGVQGMDAAEEYNRLLKSKFTPSIAYSRTF